MNISKFYRRHTPMKIRSTLWTLSWTTKMIIKFFPRHLEASMNYLLHNWDTFEQELMIISKVKNEAGNIQEWIEYHKLVGVEKFIIFDNESTDNLQEILQPYIDSGEVIYIFQAGKLWDIQTKIVDEAIRKYRNKTKWIAIIDVDEFIVPVKQDKITDAIHEIEKELGRKIHALAVNWVMYGHSGHRSKPKGLVIENYTKSSGINPHIKSIINPRVVSHYFIHNAVCLWGMSERNERGIAIREGTIPNLSDSSIEKIRINHYYTKSYDEWIHKISTYLDRSSKTSRQNKEKLPDFDPNFMSHQEDRIMDKYIPPLKQRLQQKTESSEKFLV